MELGEGVASGVVMARHVQETQGQTQTESQAAYGAQWEEGGKLVSVDPTGVKYRDGRKYILCIIPKCILIT